jgi:hypothetical protein
MIGLFLLYNRSLIYTLLYAGAEGAQQGGQGQGEVYTAHTRIYIRVYTAHTRIYMQVQKERSKAAKDKEKYIRHIRVYTYAYIRHIRVYICRCRRSAARRPRTRRSIYGTYAYIHTRIYGTYAYIYAGAEGAQQGGQGQGEECH